MRCPKCNNEMKNVMRFEYGKSFAFHECERCHTKTHQKRIHFDEVERKNEDTDNTKRV